MSVQVIDYPNTKEAQRFLRLLDAKATSFTYQTFHDKKPPTKPELVRVVLHSPALPELQQLHASGAGIYVTVNETDGKGRKSENILRVRAVWQEDDEGFSGEFPLTPSLIVQSSPGHYQRYWFVDDWPADEQGRKDFAAVMERMVQDYGSDKNAKDITRVLRLPGFLHRKAEPHLVHIIEATGVIYTRDEILAAFPPVERSQKTTAQPEWKPRDDDDARIRDAIQHINADDRDLWLQVGMAIKAHMGDAGRHLWDDWSRRSAKFNERDQGAAWRSFRRNGIGIGTLFHHAKQAGWQEKKEHAPQAKPGEQKQPRIEKADDESAWDNPDWSILDDRRGELPDFPLDVLNEKTQAMVKRTSRGAGVTADHVIVPLLGIASSFIGISYRAQVTSSWLQPATCWTVTVGYSGTGKTPGMDVTRRVLRKLEELTLPTLDKARRAHESKKEQADASRKHWQKQVKEAIEANTPPPKMPAEADFQAEYIEPRLHVSDGTIERLAGLLQARPQGMLLLRDELAALFSNMSRYSGGEDNGFWLEAWNGGSYVVERMNRSQRIDNLLFGIVGGMQPDKLARSFEGDQDGMYARVLFSWPEEPAVTRLTDDAQEIDTDLLNALGRINKLAEFTSEADGNKLLRKVLPLTRAARDEFDDFRQLLDRQKDAFEGREREWRAKISAHVIRLSHTVALLNWAMSDQIERPSSVDLADIRAGIRLVQEYFWPHARASLRQIGLTDRHTDARQVLRWIRAHGLVEVSRKEIRRDALGQKLDAEQTDQLLEFLAKAGFLRKVRTPPGPQGGPPTIRWGINQLLFNPTEGVTAVTAVTAPGLEEIFCAQCGASSPDDPPVVQVTNGTGDAWVHSECLRFWREDHPQSDQNRENAK